MNRTLVLVVLAAAATWAFLLFPLNQQASKKSSAKTEPGAQGATPAENDAVAHVPTPKAAHATASAPANATESPGVAVQITRSSPTFGQGDVRIIGAETAHTVAAPPSAAPPARPRFDSEKAQATGELGEGILSPDYKLFEESYVQEPRDGPWAYENERKIRTTLMSSELAERIVIVHCQSTVCRIQLQPQGNDPFGELVRVPGLAAVSGIDSSTPYSLNGSELIVYARPENATPQPR